ncbi:MAG: carboxypeptidase-like regulatory domain-containing protein [Cytophagaceae bacterium]|nr:carboxypeptidase-like regulatory domain-containing protein [Cytophagaceae bacterium]
MEKRYKFPGWAFPGWVAFALLLPLSSLAQDRVVSGTLRSGDDQAPIAGVNVRLDGSNTGTATDAQGAYRLSVPSGSRRLAFSYVGYLTQDVPVGNQTTVDVTLISETKNLSEIVVVGYGTVRKSDLTGALTQVKAVELVCSFIFSVNNCTRTSPTAKP